MTYASIYNLQPADRIVTPLFKTEITQHHAIYLGFNELGQELIAENHINDGVRIITAVQFLGENPKLTRIQKFQGNSFQRNLAVNKAASLIGTTYDLFHYNCEHYAEEIQYGIARSKQVNNFLMGIGILTGLFLLIAE